MNRFEPRLTVLCRLLEDREQVLLENLLRLKRLRTALTDLGDPHHVTVHQIAQAYRYWRDIVEALPFATVAVEVRDALDYAHSYLRDLATTVAEDSHRIVEQAMSETEGAPS